MHTTQSRSFGVLLLCAFMTPPASGADASREERSLAIGEDRFMGGATVTVSEPVSGDLIVAGRELALNAAVTGDVVAAGRSVRLADRTAQDAYVAGSDVAIAGSVERNARVAGRTVVIEQPGSVDGNVSAAGGAIRIEGRIGGYLQAAGGRIFINGPIGGDVRLTGHELELGPQARIAGRLHYRSENDIRQDPAAQVSGGIERDEPFAEGPGAAWFRWAWLVGVMILAAVLVAALPIFTRRTAETASSRLGLTLLVGLAVLLLVPVAFAAAAITVVGIPLALVLLLLYLLLLFLGFVFAAIALGDTGLRRMRPGKHDALGWRALAAALAVAVLGLLAQIPVLGGIIALLALLVGIGAIVAQLRWRQRAQTA